MCNRFSLTTTQPELEDRFNATSVSQLTPQYNIAPHDDIAVIQNDTPSKIDHVEWGLLPAWVKDPADWFYPPTARAETLMDKAAFSDAFEHRRCLILADGFYEWQGKRGGNRPFRVEVGDREPFAMAGLWEAWNVNGEDRETAAIITTNTNHAIDPLHDRMPVILDETDEEAWLTKRDPRELTALLDSPSPSNLRTFRISTRVNDPTDDDPGLLEPLDAE